jgi:hypothetical protein
MGEAHGRYQPMPPAGIARGMDRRESSAAPDVFRGCKTRFERTLDFSQMKVRESESV